MAGFRPLDDFNVAGKTVLTRVDLNVPMKDGRITDDPDHGPLVISSAPDLLPDGPIEATAFKDLVLDHVFGR